MNLAPTGTTSREKSADHEITATTREVNARDLTIREREIAAREVNLKASRWLNPMVIGLFAAAIGLVGNVVVARVNNQNSQDVERLRLQSNLVLEAIKTGNSNDACKNLIFFLGLGLLDDSKQTIRNNCGAAPKGGPSLPANRPFPGAKEVYGTVMDAESNTPIADALVSVFTPDAPTPTTPTTQDRTKADGLFHWRFLNGLEETNQVRILVEKPGYVSFDEIRPVDIPMRIALHRR